MLLCKFCNKQCKNDNSHRNHERLCALNPERQYTAFSDPNSNHRRNPDRKNSNAFIKAKEEGREYVVPDKTRKKLSDAVKKRSDEWNKENGKRISEAVNKRVAAGEWHTSLAKHMHIDYNGVDLHGSWELKYAQYLDANNIKWVRNRDSFHYNFDGKDRKYTPDFYLPDTDEYVEIKGYKTKKDEAKWSQFPKHRVLVVLMEDELKRLKII